MQQDTNASMTERLVIERDHAHGQNAHCRYRQQIVSLLRQAHLVSVFASLRHPYLDPHRKTKL